MTNERKRQRLVKAFLSVMAAVFLLPQLMLSSIAASASNSAVMPPAESSSAPSASFLVASPVGVIHTKSGGPLTLRAQPATSAAVVQNIKSGTRIAIQCQTTGSTVNGLYGKSNLWDKTAFGGTTGYVSDAYVYTGSHGRVAPNCPVNPANVQAVINAALSQVGKGYTYSWGGGGKSGPSYGICCSPKGYDDRHRFGYDCSGLTQFAFWKGAKIDIGGTTSVQVQKGRKVKWASRKPGDLIFWYNSKGATIHVAIYLGNNKIVESAPPRDGKSVHVTKVYGFHPEVVRIIG